MQEAVEHRREQGRGPLDEWDMFANVMATRNQLPSNHPSHLNLQQVTEMTSQEVHRTTNLPLPDTFAVRDESGHASTSGGWMERGGTMSYKPITMTMKQGYGDKALSEITRNENTDGFRKLVRTVAHEMTHVGQRRDQAFMTTSTSPQREIAAYGGEITQHPSLPALQGKQLSSTVRKFEKYSSQLGRPMTPDETRLKSSVQTQAQSGKGIGK